MLSALTRPLLPYRLSQVYVSRSISINKQHQPTKKERQVVLCGKVHPSHLGKTATAFNSFNSCTQISIRKMSSTSSSINLAALGNNFVKKVPTMEVNAGHLKPKKVQFTTRDTIIHRR